jgi:hypothetical protein
MLGIRRATPTSAAWLVIAILIVISAPLVTAPFGCGPSAVPPDQAAAVPVHNPSPDNPLKDVNLQNEYQFKEKIGGMSK